MRLWKEAKGKSGSSKYKCVIWQAISDTHTLYGWR